MSFPDVDDEPAKLRRNTLAFSVFTIIFNFLELRFPDTLLGFHRPLGSDGKIWVLILIFSVYFFARYHYSEDAGKLASLVAKEKDDLPRKLRQRGIDLMLKLHRWNFRRNFLSVAILQATHDVEANAKPGDVFILNSIEVEAYNPISSRVTENQIGYNFGYADSVRGYAKIHYAEVTWPNWFATWVRCRVWLSLITNPKFLVNVYIPYLLFFMALVFTVYRFWGATLLAAMH